MNTQMKYKLIKRTRWRLQFEDGFRCLDLSVRYSDSLEPLVKFVREDKFDFASAYIWTDGVLTHSFDFFDPEQNISLFSELSNWEREDAALLLHCEAELAKRGHDCTALYDYLGNVISRNNL